MIQLVAPTYSREELFQFRDDESEVREFEEEFADYVGCKGAVAVNSGTDALIVALRASGASDGWRLSLPSYTCRALLDAAYAGSEERLLRDDFDLRDNVCDIANARFGSSPIPGCVNLVSHMFGTRTEFERQVPGEPIIEDITLSLGAVTGCWIGVCSFNRDKMISTGRGGMIVAQSQSFLDRCRELAYYDTQNGGGYRPAFSFGMTGMQAALGRSQLAQLPWFIERRREIAARYTEVFAAAGIECPDNDVDSVFFRYIIRGDDPPGMVQALAQRDIEAGRGVNPPLHQLLGLPGDRFPGAERCFASLLSVPCHPSLSDADVEFVAEQVVEVCAP